MSVKVREATPRGASGTALTCPEDEDLLDMLIIREFELRLLQLFDDGALNGTTHTCLGQEYIPVALSPLLGVEDLVYGNHRSHGHFLSLYRDPEGLFAEIMGREGAVCNGVGGSQHVLHGRFMSTGVQGESIAAACGAALVLRRTRPGAIALTYVGDGTWGEGTVYESLNMAALWRLPLVVVVENNGIAQSTPTERQLAGTIEDRARAFTAEHVALGTCDVEAIRSTVRPLLDDIRQDPRPLVIEFLTERLGPHSKGDDSRPAPEVARVADADWLEALRHLDPEGVHAVQQHARGIVDRAVDAVRGRALSTWKRTPA